jgi:RimJ/RimL family protein N-acetyltransferase
MLVISETQLGSLETDLCMRLGWDIVDSLRETSPHSVQGLTEREIEERLLIAVNKAIFYRLLDEKDFRGYVRLSLTVGQNFDLHPAFMAILNAQGVPDELKMTRLFKVASELDWLLAAVVDVVSRSRQSPRDNLSAKGMPRSTPMAIDVDPRAYALEPLSHQHSEAYFQQSTHPDVWRAAGLSPFESLTHCRAFIENMRLEAGAHRLAIVERNNGFVGLITIHYREDEGRISYWVGRDFWGRGMGTHAIGLLLRQLERQGKPVRLIATTVRANNPSIRVLEKCNFQLVMDEASDTGSFLKYRWSL